MFEARDSSGSAIQLLTQYPRLAVDHRVSVDEDDRVTLVEKVYYFLAEKR